MAGKRQLNIVRAIASIVLVLCIAGLCAIGYVYWSQAHYYKEVAEVADVQTGSDLASMGADWDALRAENPDVVGWVVIPGTRVNYPIVQTSDNETYLHRSFSGADSWNTGGGSIFMDSVCSPAFDDDCSILYGHHMRDGSMFACLADYAEQDFFDEHRTIYVLTPVANYRLKAFACVLTTGDDEIAQAGFGDEAAFEEYLDDKLRRSAVNQGEDELMASDVEHAFMLVTCEYSHSDGRACVFASVVETAALEQM